MWSWIFKRSGIFWNSVTSFLGAPVTNSQIPNVVANNIRISCKCAFCESGGGLWSSLKRVSDIKGLWFNGPNRLFPISEAVFYPGHLRRCHLDHQNLPLKHRSPQQVWLDVWGKFQDSSRCLPSCSPQKGTSLSERGLWVFFHLRHKQLLHSRRQILGAKHLVFHHLFLE